MISQKHWWEDYPWRQVQTNLRQIDMLDIDAAEYVRELQQFNATVVMINVGGILASYETHLPFHFQSPYLKGDSIKNDHGCLPRCRHSRGGAH